METSLREWGRTAASGLTSWSRTTALVRDAAFRAERRYVRRYSDVQLRQLRSLERAYAKAEGPELLVFGDSAMFWTAPTDSDHRHLAQLISDELGPDISVEAIVGPLYNTRIVMAFLTALQTSRSRPKVVVVPSSIICAQTLWLAHPERGYEVMAQDLRKIIAEPGKRPRRLPQHGTEEAIDEWERLPAPSLYGARCTVGELNLITNAPPTTRWQRIIRLRHLMDFYNAERLEPGSIGVTLTAEMARALADLRLPSVAVIPPVNHEVVRSTLGPKALEQVEHNATLLETTYLDAGGELASVVNAAAASPATDFIDPIHLNPRGRAHLAERIAAAARPHLTAAPEPALQTTVGESAA